MTSPDSAIDWTWSIFWLKEVYCAVGGWDWGVDKILDDAINLIGE